MTAYEKKLQNNLSQMTPEQVASFIERDLATQREAVENGDMTQEAYDKYAKQYQMYYNSTTAAPSQPASSPTSAPSAVDTSYATNLTGGKSPQQIKAENDVEVKYAARDETDPEWVQQREQRDVVTQLEAVQNGDAVLTDELKARAEKVGLEVPVDTSYGANTAPQTDVAAKPTTTPTVTPT